MRAAIYSRVSTGAQEERGTSLESQVADCRALAADLGAQGEHLVEPAATA